MPADILISEPKQHFRLIKQYVNPGEEYARPDEPPFEVIEFGDDRPTVVTEFDRNGRPVFQFLLWEGFVNESHC